MNFIRVRLVCYFFVHLLQCLAFFLAQSQGQINLHALIYEYVWITLFFTKDWIRLPWVYIEQSFLTEVVLAFGAKSCCGGCPGHCSVFGSILSLYFPDGSHTPPPAVTTKTVSRYCRITPGVERRTCSAYPITTILRGMSKLEKFILNNRNKLYLDSIKTIASYLYIFS